MTPEQWQTEGERLFGADQMTWEFKCPACGHVASVQDWKDAGAPSTAVAFSCVGRWSEDPRKAFGQGAGPCDYAGGGLIGLNPVEVSGHRLFVFATEEPEHVSKR